MFDKDSLLVRSLGWFVKPTLNGLLGLFLIWIAGAGSEGAEIYAAIGAFVAYMRAAFGWPPNTTDWAPLAGIAWPLVVLSDIIPYLLNEQSEQDMPDYLTDNTGLLEPPRPRHFD